MTQAFTAFLEALQAGDNGVVRHTNVEFNARGAVVQGKPWLASAAAASFP